MLNTIGDILLGMFVAIVVTIGTGYFVAQQFAYTAVDRSQVRAGASAGDPRWRRVRAITDRTSFTLSGAQFGIIVTTLVVGFVAEPMIGTGLGLLLEEAGLPHGTGLALGTTLALLFATIVQMVFGELLPKNLAITHPAPVARALALSTRAYLALFGWLIWIFDRSATALLHLMRVEPVHDVDDAATAGDLKHILAESRRTGDLPEQIYDRLSRALDFSERTAEQAMTPRARTITVHADQPLAHVVRLMAHGRSRFPVLDDTDVVGVVCLRDVLAMDPARRDEVTVGRVARTSVLVPYSLDLPATLHALRVADEEMACVVDEYGGLAGVITTEDLAEELVGEIADEHTPHRVPCTSQDDGRVHSVPGSLHIDQAEHLLDRLLPHGRYETLGGLVVHALHRLPRPGDRVHLVLPSPVGEEQAPRVELTIHVDTVRHHVPERLTLCLDVTEGAAV
ncbi:Magnesium and cobalt efflux protein CorC [Nocardiopsis sp. JB363]|nr:Magnesium and cobalt efflux protein CorC [Nocardiopsis sp. JB363]